jgi:hypothetical protein
MKGSIFVVTLVAASLMSVSAFAHHSKGPSGPTSTNISIISQKGFFNTAVVVQAQNLTVVIGGFGEP